MGIKPFTANELFEILRLEWRQDKPYEKDETSAILWAAFINDANSANADIARGVSAMNKNIPSQGGNCSGLGLWKRAKVFSDAG